MKIKQIRQFQILVFMYKFIHGLLPYQFEDYFNITFNIHNYNARLASSFGLAISFARTNRRKNTMKIIGPYYWNELPMHIKQLPSLACFKAHFKRHLLLNT